MSQMIFNQTLESLRKQGARAATTEKTSSAKTESSFRDKMSAVSQRNEKLSSLGGYLRLLGEVGFESVAMRKLSEDGGDDSAQDMDTATNRNGLPLPEAASTITESLVAGENVPNPGEAGPVVATLSRGGDRPDNLTDPANPATTDAGGEDSQPEVGFHGDNADLSTAPEPGSVIDNLSKSSWPTDLKAILNTFGLKNNVEALEVLKNSAVIRRMPTNEFLKRSGLVGAGAKASSVLRKSLDQQRMLIAQGQIKSSSWGLLGELPLKMSASDVESEIAAAKRIIEAAVKSTKTLPEAAEVSQVAQVSPTAANIALQEVAELIAAAGGTVASAMGSAAAGAPMPAAVGAPPPPMGAVPGMPMAAPMGGPAPVPPAAPGMPMPPDQGMVAQASAGKGKRALSAADLLAVGRRILKQSADTDLAGMTREDGRMGGPENSEQVHDPGPASSTQASIEVSAMDQKMISEALGSNAKNVSVDQDDLEEYRRENADALVSTDVSNPGTKGQLSSMEPVKGTFEGNLGPSSASGSTYEEQPKTSRRKASSDMPPEFIENSKGGKEKKDEESDDEKDESEKESSPVNRILRQLWPTEMRKRSEAIPFADGGGTSDIQGMGGASAGAAISNQADKGTQKAIDYVEKSVIQEGKVPDVQTVMRHTGVNEDQAKTAIARGAGTE